MSRCLRDVPCLYLQGKKVETIVQAPPDPLSPRLPRSHSRGSSGGLHKRGRGKGTELGTEGEV